MCWGKSSFLLCWHQYLTEKACIQNYFPLKFFTSLSYSNPFMNTSQLLVMISKLCCISELVSLLRDSQPSNLLYILLVNPFRTYLPLLSFHSQKSTMAPLVLTGLVQTPLLKWNKTFFVSY